MKEVKKSNRKKESNKMYYSIVILLLVAFSVYIFSTKAVNKTEYLDYYPEINESEIITPQIITENNITRYFFELTVKPDGKGKNFVVFPSVPEKINTASKLLNSIPYCDAISYFDKNKNKSVGFVAAFGGVGKDFRIIPDTVYEISITQDINWTLPPE